MAQRMSSHPLTLKMHCLHITGAQVTSSTKVLHSVTCCCLLGASCSIKLCLLKSLLCRHTGGEVPAVQCAGLHF